MQPVDTIIFDVGNVLFQWDIRNLYARLIDDPAELDHFLGNVLTLHWHDQHDAGRPIATMIDELAAEYPQHAALIRLYEPRWLETIPGPVPGMIDLVEQLAVRGVPIYGITNFGSDLWRKFRPTAPVFDLFQDIVVSGDEKMVKPDAAIYRLAIDRFGIDPARTLFIDDREANIQGAIACGLQGHLFRDAPALYADLAARDVFNIATI
ncbi:MAG: HAD family hydrolase [Blastomonas fulva]|jgi:2-haloacid dehalogenase|uniref:HAD family hydrolase n=1 Tax=Blastomonas fulva TaxID=1550728 RepID=UPI0024E1B88F|nr:HAD family phosphatase [Blastomonas fulva]MDK2757356.1 HAD family phosphatase [Blastomonas fulva]MDM7928961.1 HAD family phosphatase [Blastomonas fulva]MDM7965848.1 HAD family phosphatase [Blastomonas fulva]